MNERSNLISKMKADKEARLAYIKGKLAVFIPAQIRALRSRSDMPRQADLAKEVEMQQSRISMFESPGAANFTIDTLARLAAVFRVGLLVKFVPLNKMLQEENGFSQDTFDVVKIENDLEFLAPHKVSDVNEGQAHLDLSGYESLDNDLSIVNKHFDKASNDSGVIHPSIPLEETYFVQNRVWFEITNPTGVVNWT